jgi:hypothetical protein
MSQTERALVEENVDMTIQDILQEWAESIPQAIIELYGTSLIHLRGILMTRKPIYARIYAVLNEIYVKYTTNYSMDLYITLTPTSVIVQDTAHSLHDKTFPIHWDSDYLVQPTILSEKDKASTYREFLKSDCTYLIVVSPKKQCLRKLMEELGNTPIIIQCMIEGESTRILDAEQKSPSNMYEEPLQIKHILYRRTYDCFARTIVALEEKHCMVVEFKDTL